MRVQVLFVLVLVLSYLQHGWRLLLQLQLGPSWFRVHETGYAAFFISPGISPIHNFWLYLTICPAWVLVQIGLSER